MKANLSLQFAGQNYLAAGLTGVLLAATLAAQGAGVVAHDAWARVPAPSKTETALYMVVENHSNQARSIVSVSSAASEKAEMHEMKMMPAKQDGKPMPNTPDKKAQQMMVMTPVSQITIPANGKATLAPNGYHIMLFGLKSALAEGDKVSVTLKLDDGATIPVTAMVRK